MLVNAMGEGGAFLTDGAPVPAHKATYVVSLLVPGIVFDAVRGWGPYEALLHTLC